MNGAWRWRTAGTALLAGALRPARCDPAVGLAGDHGPSNGHVGGDHDDHHYSPTAAGRSTGYMLVGCVAFVMAIYYAVNWFQKKPRLFAWKMISATMSVFIAVATFHLCEQTVRALFPEFREEVITTGFCLVFYIILQTALFMLKDNPLSLVAVGTISGHMFGFAAISAFEGIQGAISDLGDMCVALTLFMLLMAGALRFGAWARRREEEWAERKGADHRALEEWFETCVEAEDDAMMLALGLLMSQAVRFAILGYLPPLRGYPGDKSARDITGLLLAGVLSALLLMPSTYLTKVVFSYHSFSFVPQARLARLAQGTLAMTSSWIIIFWSQWQYYTIWHHDKMIMKTVLAVITSAAVFPMFSIFSLRCVANSGVEAKSLSVVISALGLLVGLAWEKAFDFALKEVVLNKPDRVAGDWSYLGKWFCCVLLMDIIVGPAWAFFILPKANPDMHGEHGAEGLWGDMMEKDNSSNEDFSDDEESKSLT